MSNSSSNSSKERHRLSTLSRACRWLILKPREPASHTSVNLCQPAPWSRFQPNYALVDLINADSTKTWKAAVHKPFIGKKMKEVCCLDVICLRCNGNCADAVPDGSQKVPQDAAR